MRFLAPILLVLFSGCQFSPLPLTSNPSKDDQVHWLNRVLINEATVDEKNSLRESCSKSPTLLFCPALSQEKVVSIYSKKYLEAPIVSAPKKTEPVAISWNKKGTIEKPNSIKKEPTSNLVKGLKGATLEQLKKSAAQSLKLACPNRLSAAVGALLEDYLGQGVSKEYIAKLFARSASCRTLPLLDRENYYVRAGLYYFWDNKFSKAEQTFRTATRIPVLSGRAYYWRHESLRKLGKKSDIEKTVSTLSKSFPFSLHRLMLSQRNLSSEPARTVNGSSGSSDFQLYLEGLKGLKEGQFEKAQFIYSDYIVNKFPNGRDNLIQVLEMSPPALQIERSLVYLAGDKTDLRTLKLSYPMPFPDAFQSEFGDHSFLGYAIARQESRFNPFALSIANAMGIFQLLKDTAERMQSGSSGNLFQEKKNIEVGALYIKKLLKDWKGSYPLTIASYNAGEDRVAGWVEKYPRENPALWMDLIPYRETRDYVAQVISHYIWYQKIYKNQDTDLTKILTL